MKPDLEDLWLQYADRVGVPFKPIGNPEWVNARRCFYAGVMSFIGGMNYVGDTGDNMAVAKWIQERWTEGESFWQQQDLADSIDETKDYDA
jgi:hypothetical protein